MIPEYRAKKVISNMCELQKSFCFMSRDYTILGNTERVKTGPARIRQDKTRQGWAGQGRAGQDRSGQGRAGQDRSGQDRAGQGRVG